MTRKCLRDRDQAKNDKQAMPSSLLASATSRNWQGISNIFCVILNSPQPFCPLIA